MDRDTDRREFVSDLTNPILVAKGNPRAQGLMMWPCAHKGQFQLQVWWKRTPRPLVALFRILRAAWAKLSGQDILAADWRRS